MMMKYSKYIHWMSSHKTFPFTTLSIFLLLISSSNGRPQGNDTEPIVTTTTYVSTVSPNGSATTVPSPTTTTEHTSFTSTIDTTTVPESNASSLETTFPSTLPPSSVSNGTTATEEEESNSSQTSTVTSTAPPIQQNLTSSSTIDTTTAKKGESDPTTTTAPVVTTTNIDNNDSTLDPMTTILDGNYTLSSHEVGSEELSTTPSIFTTSTKHELVSTSLESSSPSSPPSISTPVEDTTITTTTRAVETSTLSPSPDTTTTSTSPNNIYAPTDESLITTSPEDTVKLVDTTITIIPLHSTSQSPDSNITVTTIIPMDTTASPSSETDSSSSVVTTTIALTDEPSTSIVVQGSSKGDDVEMLETTTLPPHFNEESIKTSKSPILTQHEKGDGKVKNGMNSNHSKVMVKMEEKLDDLQYQIYALCGSFGVISLLIVVLLVALAYSMSKLKDQVSSTRHVPYIPDNRTDIYTGDQIHAYDNSAFSTGHEMQERRRSNLDKEVPKPGYGIHNGNNPYEKENEAESSQNKKPNTTDRDSKSTLMRYEDGVIPCNNDSTTPNGSMGRRPS